MYDNKFIPFDSPSLSGNIAPRKIAGSYIRVYPTGLTLIFFVNLTPLDMCLI